MLDACIILGRLMNLIVHHMQIPWVSLALTPVLLPSPSRVPDCSWTDGGKALLKRLHVGNSLVIEDFITVRNVFLYCLEGHSPNGYKRGDSRKLAKELGTTRSSWGDSEETTSTLREINEAMEITKDMDLQANLRAQRKKCRTDARVINVVVSSEKETYSGKIEFCWKRRTNCAGPSALMATTPTFPSGIVKKWKASVLEAAKRKIFASYSSGSSRESALLTHSSLYKLSSLRPFVISLGLEKNIVGVDATQKELEKYLESTREQ
ncbi:hypothetical protein J1N35_007313 [Gossypium stocksii]|uniref:Uncharacterized protein n=1 Tax=Gossypium stocksii TaxID=47602 RepID=A0A9D3W8X3_9ROSI|nr:hypothetical protein J1N35_007313 [Gossypium stocksii]